MSYGAVVFDLDGTLIDSLEDLADAVNQALSIKRVSDARDRVFQVLYRKGPQDHGGKSPSRGQKKR